MKKTVTKYMFFFTLGGMLILFLTFLIADYIIILVSPDYFLRIAVLLTTACISALIITIGISAFDPILAEVVFASRRMQRFESLSNPLLMKLSIEAPGTYHHALNVSNLSQNAAKAVGANTLLVRTSAYYHDIGKLYNPTKFIENQSMVEIPSDPDDESIRKQANEIIAHIEKGLEIARQNRLPEEVIDLIAEHHGTTRALYFYEKARENKLKIKRTDFRYPGPKPLSRESAILMLADSIEATVRAISNLSNENIHDIISDIIKDKQSDNQLKNSHLNENDLKQIAASFETTLLSIYHQRIEYKKHDQN